MSDDVNVVVLSGRLVADPEKRKTPSDVPVCDFVVASNRYKRKEGQERSTQFTSFVKVTLWNAQAVKMHNMLRKGDTVLVKGQLVDDNFEHGDVRTSGRLKIDNARVTLLVPVPAAGEEVVEE